MPIYRYSISTSNKFIYDYIVKKTKELRKKSIYLYGKTRCAIVYWVLKYFMDKEKLNDPFFISKVRKYVEEKIR